MKSCSKRRIHFRLQAPISSLDIQWPAKLPFSNRKILGPSNSHLALEIFCLGLLFEFGTRNQLCSITCVFPRTSRNLKRDSLLPRMEGVIQSWVVLLHNTQLSVAPLLVPGELSFAIENKVSIRIGENRRSSPELCTNIWELSLSCSNEWKKVKNKLGKPPANSNGCTISPLSIFSLPRDNFKIDTFINLRSWWLLNPQAEKADTTWRIFHLRYSD